jgi:transcriptional regulator with XRE-family HTH domain
VRYVNSLLEGEKEPIRRDMELIARALGDRPEIFFDYRLAMAMDWLSHHPAQANEMFLDSLSEIERDSVDTAGWSDRAFANAVRALLAEEELTQGDLAETMGISQSELSQILHGRRRVDPDLYATLGQALGVNPEFFLAYRLALLADWFRGHTAELDSLVAEVEVSAALPPYEGWPVRRLPDPRRVSLTELARSLVEIVEIEGPMLGARAYRLRLQASGIDHETHELRRILNRASYAAMRAGLIVGVSERPEPTQKYLVLRTSGTPEVRVRQIGSRLVSEIPLAEMSEVVASIRSRRELVSVEGIHHALAELYEIVQPCEADIERINRAINMRSRL